MKNNVYLKTINFLKEISEIDKFLQTKSLIKKANSCININHFQTLPIANDNFIKPNLLIILQEKLIEFLHTGNCISQVKCEK